MTEVAGLFVGGTGKYVAHLLKGWSKEYGWKFGNYTVFDVDTSEVLRGPFELGDDLVPPPRGFRTRVDQWINEFSTDEIGRAASDGSRPYETSALFNVAKDLKKELTSSASGLWTLRAMGLPVFDSLHTAGVGQDP